jgi:TRAP-type mannitol/chloroaromatic compound transport system substrate-binding protein
MKRRRRDLLLGMAASAGAVASFPAPALSQGTRDLKMVTSWPKGMVGLQTSAERLARSIGVMSDNRITVTVYPADSLVRPFEVFDAVGAGAADLFHTDEAYFENQSQALHFFAAVPFGMTANELCAWITFGGGQALWDEVDAQFNIKPLMALNTGVQMGGWFTKEINAPDDYKGLRYRMAGPGAEVIRRLGAIVVTTPGGEISNALKSGAIDAAEWIGPWMDTALGLDKAADYYYYPGFHEPGTNMTLGANKALWNELTASERVLIETAAQAEFARSLGEFNVENVKSLKILRAESRIKLLRFNDPLLKTFGRLSREVLADIAAQDPLTQKVHDSYMAFLAGMLDWTDLSDRGYLDARRLALS